MKEDLTSSLSTWYESLNEEDMLPNGAIKLHLPVLDTDVVIAPKAEEWPVSDENISNTRSENDTVVIKDRQTAMRAFALVSSIQSYLTRIASISQPYESGSEERQKISTDIKELCGKLAEEVALL